MCVSSAQKHISFGDASPKNVEQLRKLNLAVFPVRYNDKFYEDLANNRQGQLPYTHLAYFADIMVGAICCRVEPQEGSDKFKVYIMTIGVLAPYRRLGIGACYAPQSLGPKQAALHTRRRCCVPLLSRRRARACARACPHTPSTGTHEP